MSLNAFEFTDLFLSDGDFSARIEGVLCPLDAAFISEANDLLGECVQYADTHRSEGLNDSGDVDFRLTHEGVAYRCVALNNINNDRCFVLRRLANDVHSWKALRLSNLMRDQMLFGSTAEQAHKEIERGGIVFVFGETDSGKSTTLNALIHEIAQMKSWLIMTFEDPVEVQFTQVYSTGAKVIQRDMASYDLPNGLKTALRANADVIKVGEIRDEASAKMAVDAALAGHMVLTTLHAASMTDGLSRFTQLLGSNYALFEQAFRCGLHQKLSHRSGVNNRVLEYEFLANNRTVSNMLQDGNFKGLVQAAEVQTRRIKGGG